MRERIESIQRSTEAHSRASQPLSQAVDRILGFARKSAEPIPAALEQLRGLQEAQAADDASSATESPAR